MSPGVGGGTTLVMCRGGVCALVPVTKHHSSGGLLPSELSPAEICSLDANTVLLEGLVSQSTQLPPAPHGQSVDQSLGLRRVGTGHEMCPQDALGQAGLLSGSGGAGSREKARER